MMVNVDGEMIVKRRSQQEFAFARVVDESVQCATSMYMYVEEIECANSVMFARNDQTEKKREFDFKLSLYTIFSLASFQRHTFARSNDWLDRSACLFIAIIQTK